MWCQLRTYQIIFESVAKMERNIDVYYSTSSKTFSIVGLPIAEFGTVAEI